MALNDAATLVVGAGNYFLAPVDTPEPEDLSSIGAPWVNVGHTSIEDIMSFESDGGEPTILGTLQNAALRTSYSKRTESWNIVLQQWDIDSLRLYFGSNATATSGGKWLHVPDNPAPTTQAFLAVFADGANYFGIHALKADILRGDDLELPDTESLAGLPIRVTPVKSGAAPGPYSVTPMGVVINAWAATTAYTLGTVISLGAGFVECTTAGTSGASAPTLPASVGGTVSDGTAVWTRID